MKKGRDGIFWGLCDAEGCDAAFLTDAVDHERAIRCLREHGWGVAEAKGRLRVNCITHVNKPDRQSPLEDLKQARQCLDRAIRKLERS